MKYLFSVLLICWINAFYTQEVYQTDSIPLPIYDTTEINLKSTNAFYFCNNLYQLPRICESNGQQSCYTFSTYINKWNKRLDGQLNCYDKTHFSWATYDSDKIAKQDFKNIPNSYKKQHKNCKVENIKLTVCATEVSAHRLKYTSVYGYEFTEIVFYGTINSHHVIGHLNIENNFKSSKDLNPVLQQIVNF